MDVFILRLVLLRYSIIHYIALLPVNTNEQSFTVDSSASIHLLFVLLYIYFVAYYNFGGAHLFNETAEFGCLQQCVSLTPTYG